MTRSLLKSAGTAAAWNAAANWLGLIGGFISLIAMARLLAPVEFGLYGMALVALAIPETIACNSLNQSLIRQPNMQPGHCNSVFLMSSGLGLLFFVAMFAGAPLVADAFGQPRLTPIIRAMSAILLMGALSSVSAALLQRDLRYREITYVDVAGTTVAVVAGIILAVVLKNAWALVLMELLRRLVRMIGFIWLARWRPSLETSLQDARDLASFNLANVGLELIRVAETSLPRGIVGAVLGPAALGMLNLALRILDQVRLALVSPLGALALPVAAKSQNDLPVLHRALEGAIQLASVLAYPVFLGAAVVSPIAVPLLFGSQWTDAIPAIQIALLMGLRAPSSAFNAGILKGVGRPGLLLSTSAGGLMAILILVPLAAQHGLVAVTLALLLQQLLMWALSAWAVANVIGFPVSRQLLSGTGALGAAIVMAAVVAGITHILPQSWHASVALSVLILTGGASYLLSLAAASPATAKRILCSARELLRGNRSAAFAILRGPAPGNPKP